MPDAVGSPLLHDGGVTAFDRFGVLVMTLDRVDRVDHRSALPTHALDRDPASDRRATHHATNLKIRAAPRTTPLPQIGPRLGPRLGPQIGPQIGPRRLSRASPSGDALPSGAGSDRTLPRGDRLLDRSPKTLRPSPKAPSGAGSPEDRRTLSEGEAVPTSTRPNLDPTQPRPDPTSTRPRPRPNLDPTQPRPDLAKARPHATPRNSTQLHAARPRIPARFRRSGKRDRTFTRSRTFRRLVGRSVTTRRPRQDEGCSERLPSARIAVSSSVSMPIGAVRRPRFGPASRRDR
jgi:hypothetical protein